MKSYWSGTLTVGLLAIPVKMYGATKSHDSRFKKVHKSCMTPIKQLTHCPTCNAGVTQADLTRGHEYRKGEFIEVTDEDLDGLPIPSAGTIVLDGFAAAEILPNLRREKTVFLGPDKGGQKAYAVLRKAMQDTGKVAVGKVTIRDREHLVALEAGDKALLLTQVYYTDETNDPTDIPDLPALDAASPREVVMAKQVIDILPLEGSLDTYRDEAHNALSKILDAKAAGEPMPVVQTRAPLPPDDLLSALKRTLEAKK